MYKLKSLFKRPRHFLGSARTQSRRSRLETLPETVVGRAGIKWTPPWSHLDAEKWDLMASQTISAVKSHFVDLSLTIKAVARC